MFFNKAKNNEPHTEEYSGIVYSAKNILFYNEEGQIEYNNIASNEVHIKKVLNYVGKKLTSATISITTNVEGNVTTQKKEISNEIYTLGSEKEKDFYFVELSIEDHADVIVNIAKTANGNLASIVIEATGDLSNGITMLDGLPPIKSV